MVVHQSSLSALYSLTGANKLYVATAATFFEAPRAPSPFFPSRASRHSTARSPQQNQGKKGLENLADLISAKFLSHFLAQIPLPQGKPPAAKRHSTPLRRSRSEAHKTSENTSTNAPRQDQLSFTQVKRKSDARQDGGGREARATVSYHEKMLSEQSLSGISGPLFWCPSFSGQ